MSTCFCKKTVKTGDFHFIDTYGNKKKYWEIPACWKVSVNGNQIQTWQVFCDSKKQLDSMK